MQGGCLTVLASESMIPDSSAFDPLLHLGGSLTNKDERGVAGRDEGGLDLFLQRRKHFSSSPRPHSSAYRETDGSAAGTRRKAGRK